MGSIYKGKWAIKDKSIDFIIEYGPEANSSDVKAHNVWVDVAQGVSLVGANTISLISKLWTVNSTSFCPIMEFIAHVQCNNILVYNDCIESLMIKALVPNLIEPDSLLELDSDAIQDPVMMESIESVELGDINDEDFFQPDREAANTITPDMWTPSQQSKKRIPFQKTKNKVKRSKVESFLEFSTEKEEPDENLLDEMKVEEVAVSFQDVESNNHPEYDMSEDQQSFDNIDFDDSSNQLKDNDEFVKPKRRGRGKHRRLKVDMKDPQVCQVCDKVVNGELDLYNHQITVHPDNTVINPSKPNLDVLTCAVCPQIFRDESSLNIHVDKRHSSKLPCPICDNSFTSEKRLYYHCTTKHKKEKDLWPPPPPNSVKEARLSNLMERFDLKCGLCQLPLQNLFGLVKHERGHTEAYICILCGIPCHQPDLLIEHTDAQHPDKNEFLCRECGFFCYNEKSLTQHMQCKHNKGTKEYFCGECSFKTTVYNTYNAHVRTHKLSQPGKKYVCDECGKEFPSLMKIQNHQKSHQAEKNLNYTCQFCSKKFHLISVLRIHERVHTGEKPYDCQDCTNKFGSRSALIKHKENMHTSVEDMAYRCDECGKGFSKSRKKIYLGHIKQHSGIKDHQCPACSASFSCRPYLANHFKKVHKQKLTDAETFVSINSDVATNFPVSDDPITISIVK